MRFPHPPSFPAFLPGCAALATAVSTWAGPLEPASVFSDHAVLQRDAPIPVWGTAPAGETVTVAFSGNEATATADKEGRWRVKLAPLPASAEPATMTIRSSGDPKGVEIRDILVGEVWVGSGQSNMAGKVLNYAKGDATLAELAARAPFPRIRLMQGGATPVWTEATAETVPAFSALLFAYGERLQRDLGVPVGLIVGAVGGTPSGSWIPESIYAGSEKCRQAIAEAAKAYDPQAEQVKHEALLAAWEKMNAEALAQGEKPRGAKPVLAKKPGENYRGGPVGGLYKAWIAAAQGYGIRGVLWDQGEAGTGIVGIDQYVMMGELIRGWRELWGQGEFPFLFVQKPSGGGCAWPSAEGQPDPVTRNAAAFTAQPPGGNPGGAEIPFLYVRLMRDNPNAWMVPASDLGGGIHPPNKWGYGNRAAEVALQKVYQKSLQAYGPRYRSHRIEGARVIVQFDEVGRGLAAAHADTVQGFELAGADGVWHWVDATIEGDTVVLQSAAVPQPLKIRYAWAQNRPWANLFNRDGNPALVFEAGE